MKLGIESRVQEEKTAERYVKIDDYYLRNGMARTIKFIVREYGYTISSASKLFHEVVA